MGSSKKQTIGYKYHLGMHLVLCHGPIDAITRITVDGKVAWSGSSTGGRIFVNAPQLFGGDEREGGVGGPGAGDVDIEMGRPDQAPNDYLASQLGGSIPAFRRVVGAVLRRVYLGNNPYLKLWAFRGKRIHVRQDGLAQWYDEKAEVGGDMNPAHIVREVLTDPDWGMGYPEGDMDDEAFAAAADVLHSEGMGMSLLWDAQQDLSDFLAVVLRHIDGSLYTDRRTGKFVLRLARGGYDVDDLPVLDETNVTNVTDFKRPTVAELTNQVSVTYWDKSTGKDGSVTVQDIALAASQGSTVGTTMQYPGFTNGAIATKAASRDLKALATPLATATIYATRAAAELNIGDVFVFSWEEYGVERVVFRVSNIELGELTNNTIKLTVVEDAFSLSASSYAPPPPSEWQPPSRDAVPPPHRLAMDTPYYLMAREIGDQAAQSLPQTAGYVMAAGTSPGGTASSFELFTDAGSGYGAYGVATSTFSPTLTVGPAYDDNPETDLFELSGEVDGDLVEVGDLADTLPRPVPAGTRLLVLGTGDNCAMDSTEYAAGEEVDVKLATNAAGGQLALSSAPTETVEVVGRQALPYPPGLLRIDGARAPASASGPVSVTWAHRDRTQQTGDTLPGQDDASIGPEADVRYGIVARDAGGTPLVSRDNIDGTSATVTLAYDGDVTLEVYSVSEAGESMMRHSRAFSYAMAPGTEESTIEAPEWTPTVVVIDGNDAP